MRLTYGERLKKLGLAFIPTTAFVASTVFVPSAPAAAASNTANVSVAVTAAVQATIGVTYSAGSNISCNVGTSVSGYVACTNTATLAGSFRSTKTDTGGTSVSITAAAIPGTGTNSIPATAFEMTCTGGETGSPEDGGTAGSLASNAALSTSAVTCMNWTGEVISNYSLVVALSIDSGQVPSDTYTATNFTATATAN